MSEKINFEVLLQILIELSVSILSVIGVYTGRINAFVNPKFNVPILVSAGVLTLIAIFSFRNLFRVRHVYLVKKYMVLMVPILILMVLPLNEITNFKVDFSEIKLGSVSGLRRYEEKVEYKKKSGTDYIEIDELEYLRWYFEISSDPVEYKDDSFRFLGTVFKSDIPGEDFLIVGRLGMLCCMADLQVCGFLYDGDKAKDLKEGEWYIFEGKIKNVDEEKFGEIFMPEIYDLKIEKGKKPSEEYVYIV